MITEVQNCESAELFTAEAQRRGEKQKLGLKGKTIEEKQTPVVEPASAANVRASVEQKLAAKIPAALSPRARAKQEMFATGIAAIDEVAGGIPVGAVTELCGNARVSSGKTSLTYAILARATTQGRICALVDASDAFCPASAATAGVVLENLLWVRCGGDKRAAIKPLEQAFRVADILLNTGGFSLIVVDIADIDPVLVRKVPLYTWFRFHRFVEGKPMSLVFVAQQPSAGSYASLVINARTDAAEWSNPNAVVAHGNLLRELPIVVALEQRRGLARKGPQSVRKVVFTAEAQRRGERQKRRLG
jgi:recombination protein RecA